MKFKGKNGLVIVVALAALYFVADKFILKYTPKIYPDFGISIPRGYKVHGIDVSRYQKKVDWKLVSQMRDKGAKIDFVFIKSTEGVSLKDKKFNDNWEAVKENGMLRGAYHYFRANVDGKKQAQFFIENTNFKRGDILPVIDVEETCGASKEQLHKQLFACLDVLEEKFDDKPIIYCNADFYKKHLDKKFDDYPLWVANYEQAFKPDIERNWHIWQHHDNGHVNGIDAFVDFNSLNGDYYKLLGLCIK